MISTEFRTDRDVEAIDSVANFLLKPMRLSCGRVIVFVDEGKRLPNGARFQEIPKIDPVARFFLAALAFTLALPLTLVGMFLVEVASSEDLKETAFALRFFEMLSIDTDQIKPIDPIDPSTRKTDLRFILSSFEKYKWLSFSKLIDPPLPTSPEVRRLVKTLHLSDCRLQKVPEWIAQLTELKSLDLTHNNLTTIPAFISDFQHLRHLDIRFNPITHLPNELLNLSKECEIDATDLLKLDKVKMDGFFKAYFGISSARRVMIPAFDDVYRELDPSRPKENGDAFEPVVKITGDVDYYAALGLSPTAGGAEIRKAYRMLALRYHPDKNKDAGASEKFQAIGDAYEILSDPDKKATYDSLLKT